MKNTFNQALMAERVESLKAGIIGGLSLLSAFVITELLNNFVLGQYFELPWNYQMLSVNWQTLLSAGIAGASGLLFGVTYRYIVRQDNNPQLKAGGVMAFGLVRGLAQVDAKITCNNSVVPVIVLAGESILWFGLGGVALDAAMQWGWVKSFK
ncbi:MAG: hypothetical protein VKL59_00025 [Nostocaceae cyanobacterium]|nr:hypothetical protein [Nostocaceae cyanobacterium]